MASGPSGYDGNIIPSRVWKGSHMKKRVCGFVAAILLILLPPDLSALRILINGGSSRVVTPAMIQATARPRLISGEIRPAAVLEEMLPVFESIEEIRIIGDTQKNFSAPRGDSVLPLYRSYLLPNPDGSISLASEEPGGRPGELITGLREVRIEGDLLDDGELEVWVSWEGVTELKQEILRWGRLHGVRVTVNEVPKSDSKLLSVLRGGGRPPDLVLVQSDYLPALTAAGALQPMVRFPVDQFAEKGLTALSLDSKLYAVPFYFDVQVLFYRSDLLSLPRTAAGGIWDLKAFEESALQLRDRGIAPASWNAYSAYWLVPFQMGFGKTSMVEDDGSVLADDRPTIDAVTYLKRLADEGFLDLRERDSMFSRFISGEVAMMLSGSFSIPELMRLGVPFGIAPFPRGPEGPLAPLLDFKGFAVSRKTRHPLLARRFLLSMSDPAVQHEFTSKVFKLPVLEPAWALAEGSNPYFTVLRESYRTGVPVPSERGYKIYKNTMWKMLRFLLTGKLPVEEGLKKAQSLIDSQMSR